MTTTRCVLGQKCAVIGRTSLDEGSVPRKVFHLYNRQHSEETSVLSAGFEAAVRENEQAQTYALDRAATGIELGVHYKRKIEGLIWI